MFQDELKRYVESSNLVNMKTAGDGIYVLKYKKKVFYDGLWNRFVAECRGTIVDANFNVISYPFTKIYNYGIEKEAPKLSADTKVTAFRKVNGFMCAMTWHNGKLLVSTTGSTDSPYVAMVEELIAETRNKFEDHCRTWCDHTFMFECVHRDDPHIVPEKEGLYLLGYRQKYWGSPLKHDPYTLTDYARALGTHPVESVTTTISQLEKLAKECKHEGYVFYTDKGVSAKIKSPYYLTSKWVARNPRTDKLVDLNKDIKHNLDEEYYPLVDAIRANIVEYTAMDEQARLLWVREQLEIL
jgi:hypothetical protein